MAVSSASTDLQIDNQIDDNAGYESEGDVTKARLYLTALRMKLSRLSSRIEQTDQGSSLKAQLNGLQSEIADVRAWLKEFDTSVQSQLAGGSVITADFRDFR